MIEVGFADGAGRSIRVLGLVDSGAQRTAFPEDMATRLGVTDLASLPRRAVRGPTGDGEAAEWTVDLTVLGRTFAATVLLMPTAFVLLGRHDFFREFQVGCDEVAGELLLEPY